MALVRAARRAARRARLGLLLALAAGEAAASAAPSEYEVKAAFLLNFARLVEWPAASLAPGSPLALCVLGSSPFGGALDRVFSGKQVQGREVEIRSTEVSAADCHMVFVPGRAGDRGRQLLEATRGRSVLVVGESEGYAADGAAINLYESGGKIRFEVNRQAARAARLKVSAKLLGLARIVEARP